MYDYDHNNGDHVKSENYNISEHMDINNGDECTDDPKLNTNEFERILFHKYDKWSKYEIDRRRSIS